ncbi:hypothetical protein A3A49_00575 [Candidatus Curtissbacteria bacterium RIFCSPLOWO2_01_FULL_38_11b]|uniref:Single-stranded DNA-binding protein n=1 Tax=Candidatus Curtissbacteria bacterium RIFCSPLOWO2_01_FULL_38_11b TaxID=1797725 RepID=A0A1F5H056_9BACT|nr:MAG: hypothetical protein A3A49_00575 [Candidatus Curtissbacteria bacterium RIFCSPLOWO2_01_FULL_38_11b]
MASRASLNKVLLIGNLTRDPELRYTPSGAAVCTFGIATNRYYVASDGTKKEETEFIKIVSWNKLAELCSQLLSKGRKVYVEGRLQIRGWETPDGQSRQTTEVVIDDMRILDSRRTIEESGEGPADIVVPKDQETTPAASVSKVETEASDVKQEDKKSKEKITISDSKAKAQTEKSKDDKNKEDNDDVDIDDLPF